MAYTAQERHVISITVYTTCNGTSSCYNVACRSVNKRFLLIHWDSVFIFVLTTHLLRALPIKSIRLACLGRIFNELSHSNAFL